MSTLREFRYLTVEEFQTLPDDDRTIKELVAGQIVSEPLPSSGHGGIEFNIGGILREFVRPRRLGVVVGGDSGFILARNPDTLRGPDVAFILRERFEAQPDHSKVFSGPPDLAVEVLSKSNTSQAMHAKVADYLAAGTRLVWLVDTEHERVEVYRTLLTPRTVRRGEVLSGEDVIPGFEVGVDEIFELY